VRDLTPFYKLLGVQPQDTQETIRKAYLKLIKQWHPDYHAHNLAEQRKAEDKFRQIQEAYEHIKRDGQHSDYSPQQPSTAKHQPLEDVTLAAKPISPEQWYQKAVISVNQGDYQTAIAQLSFAIRLRPNYAEAYRYRGHLNSLLGFEHQAEADFAKAATLTSGQSSSLEQEFAQAKRRWQTHRSSGQWSPTDRRSSPPAPRQRSANPKTIKTTNNRGFWIWSGLLVAGLALIIVFQSTIESQRPLRPQPLNIETQPI
jgi:COMPASS component SWD3